MTKIILISGPPGSGKDTAGNILMELLPDRGYLEKFSGPLKAAIPAILNVPFSELERHKDVPINSYTSLGIKQTFRQIQISMSENWMKPLYGQDIFANLLIYRINQHNLLAEEYGADEPIAIVTDCGFQVEVGALLRRFTQSNCLGIQLYREGCTYEGDSRSRIVIPVQYTVHNNGSLENLKYQLAVILAETERFKECK
jgi:hypothetical protein